MTLTRLTMKKKSASQIKRMMKRAEARGEVYHPTSPSANGKRDSDQATENAAIGNAANEPTEGEASPAEASRREEELANAARKLQNDLQRIDNDTDLKSKDRRSAKRKAHALAAEATGMSAEALLELYEEHNTEDDQQQQVEEESTRSDTDNAKKDHTKNRRNPYIVFVGQLSYDTTKDQLFEHFRKELGDDHVVSRENMWIRLLTDPKDENRSRGMAFVEVSDPELLYACLKCHQTFLDGRRINVERSTGGGRKIHKSRLEQLRENQERHMESVVDSMLQELRASGDVRDGELDDGVIALCKRHSAATVQAALERYVESNGRDMDNPSAYLSFLLGKLAAEGVYTTAKTDQKQQQQKQGKNGNKKRRGQHGPGGGRGGKRVK